MLFNGAYNKTLLMRNLAALNWASLFWMVLKFWFGRFMNAKSNLFIYYEADMKAIIKKNN